MKFKDHNSYFQSANKILYRANPMTDNIWVIGDVHGCAEEFSELCKMIVDLGSYNTKIIQLGDLIDRGPSLIEVFDVIDKYNINLCIGNHELNFILEYYNHKRCGSKERIRTHEMFNKLNKQQQDYILYKIHASVNSYEISFSDPVENIFDPIETWYLSHSPIRRFEEGMANNQFTNAWTFCGRNEPYEQDKLIDNEFFAYGHQHWGYTPIENQVEENMQGLRNAMNLDGGCVYGGELVAYNICSNEYLSVKAKKSYYVYN